MKTVRDTYDLHVIPIDPITGANTELNCFLVVINHAGDSCRGKYCARNTIGIYHLNIHLVEDLLGDGTCQTDTKSIAMGGLTKIKEACALNLNSSASIRSREGACDIRIHTGTAVVFANFINDQDIPFANEYFWHILKGQL